MTQDIVEAIITPMRRLCLGFFALLALTVVAQTPTVRVPADDAVRIREFYRLATQIQDQIWPHWSEAPNGLLLVTQDVEFLTHFPDPPKDFKAVADGFYARPRQFQISFLATFPAFGPPSVIVVGQPKNTTSKTSTRWLFTLMHEHFHQFQSEQPGYYRAVDDLGLSHGDTSGMWMLNYPFPYEKAEVAQAFAGLRDLLLSAVEERDEKKFAERARQYAAERNKFLALVSPDDRKYFSFQLWQEGVARYTEIKAAEAAAHYQPAADYAALSDYETFSNYAARPRRDALEELKKADLAEGKRTVVYSFGAAEALLLDRMKPHWKDDYFKHPLSMDAYFEN